MRNSTCNISEELLEGFTYFKNYSGLISNITQENESVSLFLPITIVSFVTLISIATVLGNITVILCIVKSRSMYTVYNIYAVSLAIADLMVGVLVMTNMSVYSYHGYWPLGNEMCTVWIVFDFTCCTISMLHLDAVAFDRYKSVTSPLVYRTTFTKLRAVKISSGMWMLGMVLWLPAIVWFRAAQKLNGQLDENDCFFLPDKYFIAGQVSVAYYVPVCFMVAVYLKLFVALNKRIAAHGKGGAKNVRATVSFIKFPATNRRGDKAANGVTSACQCDRSYQLCQHGRGEPRVVIECSSQNTTSSESSTRQNRSVPSIRRYQLDRNQIRGKSSRDSEKEKISGQNRRCIRTLGGIILAFLACWLPFTICWPLAAFCETCVSESFYQATYWLAYGNSFINPYLYFLLNKDFRRAFRRIFLRNNSQGTSLFLGLSNNST